MTHLACCVCVCVHILYALASLYPLGTVPEICSVDVKQPAGQYLLRGEKNTHSEYQTASSLHKQRHRASVIYLNSASGKSVPLSRQVIRSAKGKRTVSELDSLIRHPFLFLPLSLSLSDQTTTSERFQEIYAFHYSRLYRTIIFITDQSDNFIPSQRG